MLTLRCDKLTADEQSDFSRFILSLRARHPDAVAFVKTTGQRTVEQTLARNPEEYGSVKSADQPKTLAEFAHEHAPMLMKNFGLSLLPRVINDDTVGERIFRMAWWTQDVREAQNDLLLSDRPCVLKGNAADGDCVITLPISPTMVFFISNRENQIGFLRSMRPDDMVKMINRASVGYAVERVYGTGAHHLRLVEKWLR